MSQDVTFKYTSGGKQETQILRWADRIASREGLGLWHVGNYAWKIYASTAQYQRLLEDYNRAGVHGLPMGQPRFQQGTVQRGTNPPTQGFALIVNWMTGTFFDFHTPPRPLRSALQAQDISHSKSSTDYKRYVFLSFHDAYFVLTRYSDARIKGGCDSASVVGLQDCQGYVKAGAYEPIAFIDVHTSWNAQTGQFGYSQQAQDLVATIVAWGTSP